jgi:hypothetical protein
MAYTANKLMAQAMRRLLDFDPDSGSEVIATLNPAASEKCLSLGVGIQAVLVGLFRSVGAGAVTSFRIFVADNAAGTTNAANVVSHALGSAPDAVGDTVWLEATAEQLRAASSTAAYWGVKVTLATSTDECVLSIVEQRKNAYDGLTADYIS